MLVAAMKPGAVPPWSLGFWQKQDLVLYRDPDIRTSARALLEQDPLQRAATIKRYAAALDLGGEPAKGEPVFARVCAACHTLDGRGGDLGPNLATVRHRPPLSLLGDILLPSQSIAQGYQTYSHRTDRRKDGNRRAWPTDTDDDHASPGTGTSGHHPSQRDPQDDRGSAIHDASRPRQGDYAGRHGRSARLSPRRLAIALGSIEEAPFGVGGWE